MDSKNPFLKLQQVSKKYKDTRALNEVSFDVYKGEIFGYIGPNGAGKTTTIKILIGLIQDFEGIYHINGVSQNKNNTEIQKILGYLPQGVSFQEWRTVNHVLSTLGKLSGLDGEFLEAQIKNVLELMELSEVRHKKVSKLSGGMIQKLGFAQALLNKPKFLVLDEPLSGLDPTSRYEVKKIIKKLSQEGTTVFFSSHILSDVQDIANRIAIIDKGQILKIGNTNELTSDLYSDIIFEVTFFDDFKQQSILKSLKGIKHIDQQNPNKIFIHINKDSNLESLSLEILKTLINNNCYIQRFTRIMPNLDEVYLKYVKGKK
ncbi:ABC transporter ATP-binding protein [candidate division KSB1 bacterium]|nr:ABC transporter ATP-binding protein [candidate division KSB1 bacterium]MBL7093896.1 ABC transporter ATP-binding protein [candidate division KSB1 bacterium]